MTRALRQRRVPSGQPEIDDDQAGVALVSRDESLVDAGTAARRFATGRHEELNVVDRDDLD